MRQKIPYFLGFGESPSCSVTGKKLTCALPRPDTEPLVRFRTATFEYGHLCVDLPARKPYDSCALAPLTPPSSAGDSSTSSARRSRSITGRRCNLAPYNTIPDGRPRHPVPLTTRLTARDTDHDVLWPSPARVAAQRTRRLCPEPRVAEREFGSDCCAVAGVGTGCVGG